MLRPVISFPATKWDNQSIKRQHNFLRKPQSTHAHTLTNTRIEHIDIHRYGWSVCLCIYSKTWKCSLLSPDDRRSETVACTCTHTGTHTNTHPDRCCIVMACPSLAACFPQTSHPVWWLRDGEMKGEAGTRGRRWVRGSDRTECRARDSLSIRRLSKSYH